MNTLRNEQHTWAGPRHCKACIERTWDLFKDDPSYAEPNPGYSFPSLAELPCRLGAYPPDCPPGRLRWESGRVLRAEIGIREAVDKVR